MGEGRQAGLKGAEFFFIRRFGKQNDKGTVEKKGERSGAKGKVLGMP